MKILIMLVLLIIWAICIFSSQLRDEMIASIKFLLTGDGGLAGVISLLILCGIPIVFLIMLIL